MSDPDPQANGIEGMGKGMLIVFFLVVLGFGSWVFDDVLDGRENPNGRVTGTLTDGVAEVRLQAGSGGHYVAEGTINGRQARMLVDTGATSVAVPLELASAIGLRRGPRIQVDTANGRADAWLTRIDRLQLGSLEFRDVEATIAPGLDGEVLLGMSALRHVEFTQRGRELVLRQAR